METPFRAISWSADDTVTKDVVEQMSTNINWIKDNSPSGRDFSFSPPSDTKMVILGGRVWLPPKPKAVVASANVYFGPVFAPNSSPNVSIGINSSYPRMYGIINGIGAKQFYPDARGFNVTIFLDYNKGERLKKGSNVHWIAVGRRR